MLKNYVKLLITLLFMSGVNGQITLVKNKLSNIKVFNTSSGKIMFIDSDTTTKKITLYNEDLSIYKTINFPIDSIDRKIYTSENYQSITPLHTWEYTSSIVCSDKFFNQDEKLEFIYTYWRSGGCGLNRSLSYILNEDGKVLKTFSIAAGEIDFNGFGSYLKIKYYEPIIPCQKYKHTSELYKVGGYLNSINSLSNKIDNISNNYDTLFTYISDTVNILKIKFKLTTGIKAGQLTSMDVYPNPASELLIIEANDIQALSGYKYKILDLQGKEVYNALATSVKTEISLKSIGAKGMYILHIVDEKGISIENKKIVLE
jgi:hypothetical protein